MKTPRTPRLFPCALRCAAIIVLLGLGSAQAVLIDFEAPQYTTTGGPPFNNGNLGGQGTSPNTWSSPTGDDTDKLRVVANPFLTGNSSAQAVQLFDTTSTGPSLYRIFSPSLGETFDANSSILSFSFQFLYADLAASTTASLRFALGEFGSGLQTLQVEFTSTGGINFTDSTTGLAAKDGVGNNFVAPLDQWITLSGVANYGTNTYTLFVNGVQQVGTGGGGDVNLDFFSTTSKTQVFNMRAMGSTGTNYAPIFFDNINYEAIPEPGTCALLGVGLAAWVARSRGRFRLT